MSDYSLKLRWAKDAVTEEVCASVKDPTRVHEFAGAVDRLNKAWDELTNCLVRQRDERDRIIRDLTDQLAESRKS